MAAPHAVWCTSHPLDPHDPGYDGACFSDTLELDFGERHASPDAVEIAFNLGLTLLQLGTKDAAAAAFARTVALQPSHIEAWFSLGLVRQDLLDLAGAAQAFRSVLAARPEHAEAAVNLGIVLQEAGAMEAAMAAYAEAVRRRPETFGPVVQAMCGASTGRLFLVPGALRRSLARR